MPHIVLLKVGACWKSNACNRRFGREVSHNPICDVCVQGRGKENPSLWNIIRVTFNFVQCVSLLAHANKVHLYVWSNLTLNVICHGCGWIDVANYEEEHGSTMGVHI
jgi:hypothetical protein